MTAGALTQHLDFDPATLPADHLCLFFYHRKIIKCPQANIDLYFKEIFLQRLSTARGEVQGFWNKIDSAICFTVTAGTSPIAVTEKSLISRIKALTAPIEEAPEGN